MIVGVVYLSRVFVVFETLSIVNVGVVADGGDPGLIHLRYIISNHCLSAFLNLL